MPDDLSAPVDQEPTGSATVDTPPDSAGDTHVPEKGAAPEIPEKTKEGKPVLDPEKLPDDASQKDKDYATQMMRYFSKRTESMAEQMKKAKEYDAITQSQDWGEFQNWRTSRTQAPEPQPKESTVDATTYYLQKEMDDAIANGDSQKMFEVTQKLTDYRLQKTLSEKEKYFSEEMSKLTEGQRQFQNERILEEFGKLHPKLWDYHKAGIAVPILREFERQGKSLEEAYTQMEQVARHFGRERDEEQKKIIAEKKQAVTQTPSSGVEGEYVYVNSRREADKLNLQFAMDGSNKIAVMKK